MMRRFLKDRRGAAAVEFALVAPFLVAALLGASEAFFLIQASSRALAAAYTVADLTAQDGQQTTASLNSIVAAAQKVMDPLPSGLGTLAVSIASVGYDGASGSPMLLWQYHAGGAPAVDPAQAKGLVGAGTSVIMVSLAYHYAPVIPAFVGAVTFNETALSRPRLAGGEISLNGQVQWP